MTTIPTTIPTTVRTEWGIRYPDGHVEYLYSQGGLRPYLPDHARDRGAHLVYRLVTTTEWR